MPTHTIPTEGTLGVGEEDIAREAAVEVEEDQTVSTSELPIAPQCLLLLQKPPHPSRRRKERFHRHQSHQQPWKPQAQGMEKAG